MRIFGKYVEHAINMINNKQQIFFSQFAKGTTVYICCNK